jgi:hypothetical protein
MKKILKEPLVHFLLIGALLFLVYGMVNTEKDETEIAIDDNLINELAAKWELKRSRQPTLAEINGMVEKYIEQEILYREALAMNLDHNDEIVKRRLAQKMEFISDGLAESLQPTEEVLKDYYEKHRKNYPKDPIYTLQHVYFSNDKRTDAVADATNALIAQSPQSLGDNISLPNQYTDASAFLIARDYGSAFANSLDALETGKWSGPITSGFGVHIVNVQKKKVAGYYTFKEVLEKVTIDYNFDASNTFKTELINTFLKNYNILVDVSDATLKKSLDEKY